jgi:RimJ/RimL family protein N-acetyltransferase
MLIGFLFCDKEINEKAPLNKIILDTNKKNVRAQHVYEKLGFKKVRENINSWQDQLGVWQTSIDYELTRDEAFQQKFAREE